MARKRVDTGRLEGNQGSIDEFEFYLEGIGRFLFGSDGEDFRKLGSYVPRTRNLSALLDASRRKPGREIAEDLQFLYDELETRALRTVPVVTPRFRRDVALFSYDRYVEVVSRPERMLELVTTTQRLEVALLLGRGVGPIGRLLSQVNAFAWLSAVGLPDLARELSTEEPARFTVASDPAAVRAGLDRIYASSRTRLGHGARAYFDAAHEDFQRIYQEQLQAM